MYANVGEETGLRLPPSLKFHNLLCICIFSRVNEWDTSGSGGASENEWVKRADIKTRDGRTDGRMDRRAYPLIEHEKKNKSGVWVVYAGIPFLTIVIKDEFAVVDREGFERLLKKLLQTR